MKALKTTLVYLLGSIVLLLVLEGGARIYDWSTWPKRMENSSQYSPPQGYNPNGLGDQQPNIDTVAIEAKHAPMHYVTNAEGFYSPIEFDKNRQTILAVGASFTYGAYVHTPHNYPSLLQSLLEKRYAGQSPYQVMNAGFPAYDLDSVKSYLQDKGLRASPKIVLIQLTAASVTDFSNNAQNKELGFFRREQQKSFELHEFKRTLRSVSAVYALLSKAKSYMAQRKAEAQALEIIKNRDAQDVTDDRSRRVIYDPEAPDSRKYWDITEERIRFFIDLVKPQGAAPVFVLWPNDEQLIDPAYSTAPQEQFKKLVERNDGYFLDLLPALRDAGDFESLNLRRYPISQDDLKIRTTTHQYPKPITYTFAGMGHYSRYGNYVIAKAVLSKLEQLNLLETAK